MRLELVHGTGHDLRRSAWSTGAGRLAFASESAEADGGACPMVYCRLGEITQPVVALLDTAAEYSVLPEDVADAAGAGEVLREVHMSTRFGKLTGRQRILPVELVAKEGRSLRFDATVLSMAEWNRHVVLGFRGLLERIRFGLEPAAPGDDGWFYFGSIEDRR